MHGTFAASSVGRFELKVVSGYNNTNMHYLRRITDLLPRNFSNTINRRFIALYLRDFLFLVGILIAGVLLQILVDLYKKIDISRQVFEAQVSEYAYWQAVAAQYPNIPDIQYNASVGALKVGRLNEAIYHIDRALMLDPLFEKAQKLKNKMVDVSK